MPQFSKIQTEAVPFFGGLDLVTPSLSLKPGFAKKAINFECSVTGGYARIGGYERSDGHPSPSAAKSAILYLTFTGAVAVGNTVIGGTSGSSGVVTVVASDHIALVDPSGGFSLGETISVGASPVGVVVSPADIDSDLQAQYKAAAADVRRALIGAIPGSGPVVGIFGIKDQVYGLRNAVGGATKELYKQTGTGWSKVSLNNQVAFSAGSSLIPDGATLTQGGVTATILRASRRTGAWLGGTAAGILVIGAPIGGHFAAGAATITGGITCTLGGAESAITLVPGGKLEWTLDNLKGGTATTNIYAADGVGPAFEFDGTVLVPIVTGAAVDTPTHVEVHRKYLFLSLQEAVYWSAPGDPYDFAVANGAGANALGDTVTGLILMPGSQSSATMAVFTQNNTMVLYGNSHESWNWVAYNTGSGARSYSCENMAQTLAFDDRGVISLQTSLNFGNFDQNALTYNVLPFINKNRPNFSFAVLNRAKSQYRLFFNDGNGLYLTIVNGQTIGSMPVYFPNPVLCCYDWKTSAGEEVSYFGSDNGMVYQMEKGTSFDGANIYAMLQPNFANLRSPRVLKRFFKSVVEVQGSSYVKLQFGYLLGYGSGDYVQPNISEYSNDFSPSYWDEFTWDEFRWDGRELIPFEFLMSGTAENVAAVFRCDSNYINSFTINSEILHYALRRAMR